MKGIEISSSHALFVDFVFENDGTIVVDDRKSTSVGVWKINDGSFTNTGDIMFTSSKGSKFDISAKSVTNTGFIYSKGTDANTPQILKIGNNADNWYNTGTICLANTTFNLKIQLRALDVLLLVRILYSTSKTSTFHSNLSIYQIRPLFWR